MFGRAGKYTSGCLRSVRRVDEHGSFRRAKQRPCFAMRSNNQYSWFVSVGFLVRRNHTLGWAGSVGRAGQYTSVRSHSICSCG